MLKETYCSYEVSKLLKEKGFNEKCRGGYHSEFDDNDNPIVMLEKWTAQPYNNDFVDEGFLCSAPTHQMAMAWLREVHNLYIEIFVTWRDKIPHYQWRINNLITQDTIVDTPCLEKPEEAVEAALKYSLENLI